MCAFYRKCVALRQTYPALQKGDFEWLLTDNGTRVLAFQRTYQGTRISAVFNAAHGSQNVPSSKIGMLDSSSWTAIEGDPPGPMIKIKASSFAVYVNTH